MFSSILQKSRNTTSTLLLLLQRGYSSTTTTTTRTRQVTTNRRNLYSRISPLGNPSINLVPVLDEWVQQGNPVKPLELKRIIKHLRSHNRFSQALQISEWISSKGGCPISASDRAVQLDLIGRVRGLDTAESYFHNLSDEDKNLQLNGALLNCYVREGLVDKSLSQMQKMKEMGFVSVLNFNNIMCLYKRTDQLEKVPGVLDMMKEDGVSPDIFSYWICINSYGARSDLANMEKLLEEMERDNHIGTDWKTYSLVANFYIKAGLKEKALICLKKCEDKLDKRNALPYNHLISHYASLGNKKAMMRIWQLQKSNCKKQLNREYITMLASLMKIEELDEAEKLLEEWESSGNCYDFRVPAILLNAYSQRGLVEKAETMLRRMVDKGGKTATPNSWAIIASGYVAKENMEKAFQCMKEAMAVRAENSCWRPNANVISSILNWATDNRDVAEVEDLVNSLKTVISTNREIYLSLIKVYVRSGEKVDEILESMKADKIEIDEEIQKILSSRL